MARPLRLEFPGALNHVIARGNAREPIFADDDDRPAVLDDLSRASERFDWASWAYCLMDTHYPLLIQTRQPNLARGMREVNGIHTQRFNRRHRRVGHVLQGELEVRSCFDTGASGSASAGEMHQCSDSECDRVYA